MPIRQPGHWHANALRESHLLQSLVSLKEDIIYLNIKAFNKFQALTYLHCIEIASTYSCKRKMMEEKLGRKKKNTEWTQKTLRISALELVFYIRRYAQTAKEVNFGIFLICFFRVIFSKQFLAVQLFWGKCLRKTATFTFWCQSHQTFSCCRQLAG